MARATEVPVSFVIPARDAAGTIEQTLASVAAQTTGSWEAIVVDDGSTDETPVIAQRRADADARFRLLRRAPGGVSAARNAGLEAARHPWVAFLDADDLIAPAYLERTTAALAADPALDGVRCGWAYMTADGRVQPEPYPALDSGRIDLFGAHVQSCPVAIHAFVLRGALVRAVGGFDPGLTIGEDWDLWLRLGRRGTSLPLVPEMLAFHLVRPWSATRRDFTRLLSDYLIVVDRAHAADARVRDPLPQYAAGSPRDEVAQARAGSLAWALALCASQGADARPLLLDLEFGSFPVPAPGILALALYDEVPLTLGRLRADWPALWGMAEPRMRDTLAAVSEWAHEPTLAESTLRRLERNIARDHWDARELTVGRTHGITIDVARPLASVSPPAGTERLVCRVTDGATRIGVVELPVLAERVQVAAIAAAIYAEHDNALLRNQFGDARRWPRNLPAVVRARVPQQAAKLALDLPWGRGHGARKLVRDAMRTLAASTVAVAAPLSHEPAAAPAPSPSAQENVEAPAAETDAEYWEATFATPDPWDYTNPYEQLKYEQTLSLLPAAPIRRALELACAEGHFTIQLAPRVAHLVATDISETALERAAERCAGLDNIEYRRVDLGGDPLPAHQDLITCCEVLYYLPDEAAVVAVGRRVAAALVMGGTFITAHGNLVVDEPDRTGFDWVDSFGAKRLGELLGSVPGLRLITELHSPLYRIQRFQRVHSDAPPGATPEIREIPHACELPPQIARMAVWGGVSVRRRDALRENVTARLPILMYHRITPAGPPALDDFRVTPERFAEHLDHLRRHGYYGTTLGEWRYAHRSRRALPGRAVLITFDDGYEDLLEHAAPLLNEFGFGAAVFVVTGQVGGVAEWDRAYGEPAPLLSWSQLRHLQRQGIEIGSHTATHQPLTGLAPAEALRLELGARATLKRELGRPVVSMAYPYGDADAVVRRTMAAAGYELGLSVLRGHSSVWDNPLWLPRIEVTQADDAAALAAKLGPAAPVNPLRRGLRRVRGAR